MVSSILSYSHWWNQLNPSMEKARKAPRIMAIRLRKKPRAQIGISLNFPAPIRIPKKLMNGIRETAMATPTRFSPCVSFNQAYTPENPEITAAMRRRGLMVENLIKNSSMFISILARVRILMKMAVIIIINRKLPKILFEE